MRNLSVNNFGCLNNYREVCVKIISAIQRRVSNLNVIIRSNAAVCPESVINSD